jgi:hypothetical protein
VLEVLEDFRLLFWKRVLWGWGLEASSPMSGGSVLGVIGVRSLEGDVSVKEVLVFLGRPRWRDSMSGGSVLGVRGVRSLEGDVSVKEVLVFLGRPRGRGCLGSMSTRSLFFKIEGGVEIVEFLAGEALVPVAIDAPFKGFEILFGTFLASFKDRWGFMVPYKDSKVGAAFKGLEMGFLAPDKEFGLWFGFCRIETGIWSGFCMVESCSFGGKPKNSGLSNKKSG